MKTLFNLMIVACILPCFSLKADWGTHDTIPETQEKLSQASERGPFSFTVEGDCYGKSTFEKHCFRKHKIDYWIIDAEAQLVVYYNPEVKEGAAISAGFVHDRIEWEHNPFFKETNFNTPGLAFSFFTERGCNWIWKSQVRLNIELNHFKFSDNLYFDLVLWGRYAASETLGFNVGFLGYTGMKIDRVYPIIGVDWQPNSNWKFSAVFPVDISAEYIFNDSWSVEINSRFVETRHRLSENERLSGGTIEYRNSGFELALNYDYGARLAANIHAGYLIGGRVEKASRHYKQRKTYRFGSAPYVGGEIALNF